VKEVEGGEAAESEGRKIGEKAEGVGGIQLCEEDGESYFKVELELPGR
jgi:hypothetical protein